METCVFGAVCNVEINLKDLKDSDYAVATKKLARDELKVAEQGCNTVLGLLDKREQ